MLKIYFRLFEIIQMVVSVIYVFKIVWLNSCLPKPGDKEWSEDGLGYVMQNQIGLMATLQQFQGLLVRASYVSGQYKIPFQINQEGF